MQGETITGLVRQRQKSGGELIDSSVSFASQQNERGETIGLTVIIEDITERKRAEESVRESQKLLELVLATLPVGVLVIDQKGNMLLVTAALKRIWGGDPIVSGAERWAKYK